MTLPRDMLLESLMILMGCYYVFQLTYSKCIARLLSIIQTEVLKDFIHESDKTTTYKKVLADCQAFIQT